MGHETVGRIRELGTDVAGLTVGQLVTVNPVMSCHACPACLAGQEHRCSRRVVLGVAPEIPAAFADRVAVPAANIVPLPEDMPEELGALVEPMAVGYHAVRRGQPVPNDRVLVIGGGPIGAGVPPRRPAAWHPSAAIVRRQRFTPPALCSTRCGGGRSGRRQSG
jgi:threonine dehydrogenase-like Zn-dependent dehydrogenase